MNTNFSLCLLTALTVAGCRADDPPHVQVDFGRDGPAAEPDLRQQCPPTSAIPRPTLDNGPSQVATQTPYPLRGIATGASTLIVTVGSGRFVGNVSASGRFCIELDLQQNLPNQIQLTPRTDQGCPGESSQALITHQSLPHQDAGVPPTIENRALGRTVESNQEADEGSLSYLNDGIETNSAILSMWDPLSDKNTWLRLDLGRSYLVSRVRIVWGPNAASEQTYAATYAIALSDEATAKNPDENGWTTIFQESAGKHDVQEIHFSPTRARTAAIRLFEDGKTNYFGWETFSIAEIEVFGQDPNATPPILPDSCNHN